MRAQDFRLSVIKFNSNLMLLLLCCVIFAGTITALKADQKENMQKGDMVTIVPNLLMGLAGQPPRSDADRAQLAPAIAFGAGKYLLVWQEGFAGLNGQSVIKAIRLDSNGNALDKEAIVICGHNGICETPAVTFVNGFFVVVWADMRNGRDHDIYAAFVSPDEDSVLPVNGFMVADGEGAQCFPAIATGENQFLIAWQGFVKDHYEIFVKIFNFEKNELKNPEQCISVLPIGERPQVSWNGDCYMICQRWHAALIDREGHIKVSSTPLWRSKTVGESCAVTAWGDNIVFFDTEPFPDPWGWGGSGALIGSRFTNDGKTPDLEVAPSLKKLQGASADGLVANCIDATRWRNHPGWPMGMRGGLKGSHDGTWVSGRPSATFNGQSLVCVWTRAQMVDNRRLRNRDIYLRRIQYDWGMIDAQPIKLVATPDEEANPVIVTGPRGEALLAYETAGKDGVTFNYRLLKELPDVAPPKLSYTLPDTDTSIILGFDKPVEPKSLQQAGVFNIKGFTISNVTFNTDARALQREVIIETNEKIVSGTKLKLRVNGVADRNFPSNYATRQEYTVVAKPGESQKGQFIDKWVVLGPFPSARDKTLKEFARIINPAKFNAFSAMRPEAEWITVESQIVDFGRLFGEISDQMAIAVTYVYSEKSRKARLRLDTNDHNRAWLNGKLINDGITGTTSMRGFHDFADEIDIKLKAGWNHCVVLVDNHLTAWLMSGQIVDENGVAIRDLTWQIRAP